ncbi:MAG TPA: nucleoside 2-deoxyribosyltransferase [Chitinophagaceae bacterium]|nr:nucleoside 2-deoxyribosyltransferase [Chitinophagaceae bacterium]HPH31892.1 nucleoside 2-deoxyribosyltransferase [Chitinophagaceae bacterium]
MKAYIAIPYQGRKEIREELDTITSILNQCGVSSFVFADQYSFKAEEEKEMMQQAMEAISQSDWLIAFASEKAIGIGIEAGYAKGKGKPVIYIRHIEAEHSTTLSGISDYQIIYVDLQDLAQKLIDIVEHL